MSAATNEQGRPGMICAAALERPWTWQNSRSGEQAASERSCGETSAVSTVRPPKRGSGSGVTRSRKESASSRPWFKVPYSEP
jgi:hypothetical protein